MNLSGLTKDQVRYTSNNMVRAQLTVDNKALLEAALEGLELQKSRIDDQIEAVRRMLGTKAGGPLKAPAQAAPETAAPQISKRRELSPAARRRIAAAQKKRWAAFRKNSAGSGGKTAGKREA
jgi:hypothetical protein